VFERINRRSTSARRQGSPGASLQPHARRGAAVDFLQPSAFRDRRARGRTPFRDLYAGCRPGVPSIFPQRVIPEDLPDHVQLDAAIANWLTTPGNIWTSTHDVDKQGLFLDQMFRPSEGESRRDVAMFFTSPVSLLKKNYQQSTVVGVATVSRCILGVPYGIGGAGNNLTSGSCWPFALHYWYRQRTRRQARARPTHLSAATILIVF
jgi:hypothetical protein